jgi:hypothetical protein
LALEEERYKDLARARCMGGLQHIVEATTVYYMGLNHKMLPVGVEEYKGGLRYTLGHMEMLRQVCRYWRYREMWLRHNWDIQPLPAGAENHSSYSS